MGLHVQGPKGITCLTDYVVIRCIHNILALECRLRYNQSPHVADKPDSPIAYISKHMKRVKVDFKWKRLKYYITNFINAFRVPYIEIKTMHLYFYHLL